MREEVEQALQEVLEEHREDPEYTYTRSLWLRRQLLVEAVDGERELEGYQVPSAREIGSYLSRRCQELGIWKYRARGGAHKLWAFSKDADVPGIPASSVRELRKAES